MSEGAFEVQDALLTLVGTDATREEREEALDGLQVVEAYTFQEWGVLSTNAGLVLRVEGGTEYQVTIVQSR